MISNKHRAIRETEVELIREFFLKPRLIFKTLTNPIKTLYSDKLIEISFQLLSKANLPCFFFGIFFQKSFHLDYEMKDSLFLKDHFYVR